MMTLEEAINSLRSDYQTSEQIVERAARLKPIIDEVTENKRAAEFAKGMYRMYFLQYLITPKEFTQTILAIGVLVGILMERQDKL